MIGFTTSYLIPRHIIHHITNVLSRLTIYQEHFYDVLGKLFQNHSSLFEYTGILFLERKSTGNISVYQIHQESATHPWGIPPPTCCDRQEFDFDRRRKGPFQMWDIFYIITCQSCLSTTQLCRPDHGIRLGGSCWGYPWPESMYNYWDNQNLEWILRDDRTSQSDSESDNDNKEDLELELEGDDEEEYGNDNEEEHGDDDDDDDMTSDNSE